MTKRHRIRKPWYARKRVIIPAALLACALIGAIIQSVGGEEDPLEAGSEPTQTLETPATEETLLEEREPEATGSERLETASGLGPTSAQVACVNFGDSASYPDKLKIHTIMGKKQEQVNDDEIRFLWDATLTSAAGGEIKGEVLCVVTGTDEAPAVETFEFR